MRYFRIPAGAIYADPRAGIFRAFSCDFIPNLAQFASAGAEQTFALISPAPLVRCARAQKYPKRLRYRCLNAVAAQRLTHAQESAMVSSAPPNVQEVSVRMAHYSHCA